MANRTFKVYGQAYAASGDVSVVMTVGGTEVFNGAVNDSSTVRSGPPSIENHLWTYELDETVVGDLAVSIAVTGGELCLGPTQHNLSYTQTIPTAWFDGDHLHTAESQTYVATQIGQSRLDAEQAGLYDALVAGTATNSSATFGAIMAANKKGPRSAETFLPLNDVRSELKINDDASHSQVVMATDSLSKSTWTVILQSGDSLTYTWSFDPDNDAFTS